MTGDHLFMSHGVSLLAADDRWPSTAAFRAALPPVAEDRTDPVFTLSHPTPDHYLPLLVAAGLGDAATLVHRSWPWSSLSMSTWRFGS